MQINTGRNANELKQARRSGRTSSHQTRKSLLLGVVNLLVGINIWAQVVAPNGLSASSVCSNSVTLSWVDPNTNSVEQSVLVLRSTRSLNKGYTTIATLPAYTTTYTDTGVVGSKTYYYRISILNSSGRKYTSNPISVTTSPSLTLSPSSSNVPDVGGSTNALVIAGSGCGWTASSTDTWITVDGGNTGFGTGTVTYSVAPNTSTSSRTGSVMVANQTVKVTQNSSSACTYLASPTSANIVADGGSGSFTVTPSKNGNACSWTATPTSNWIHTSSSGSGIGIVSYTVDPNTGTSPRTGTITVTDNAGGPVATYYTLTQAGLPIPPPPLTITTASPLPTATAGVAYSQTLTASGGTTPYSWSISAGALPSGLTLSSAGVLSGTPTTATTANFTVQCTGGSTTTKAFSLTVNPAALTITTASPLPAATAGVAYSQTFTASGGTTPYSWSISAGSLPAGLTLSSAGVLSGTPTTATTASFTVQCTGGSTTTQAFSLTVNPAALTITTASPLPTATAGVAYSQILAASGGTTPRSWSISAGALPPGLTLSSAGVLSGTPTTATTATFTVQCTGGSTTTKAFSLTVNPAALTITTVSPLPAATAGVAYSQTLTANGGTTPYSWSISAGSLPAGLTLSSAGVLSGTPTTATTATFTVQCTGGTTTTTAFSLTVNLAVVNYTVTTTPNPVNGGTTTPNASFSNGSTVTAQATVNSGYSFVNWTQNGAMVSTSPSYSFQLNANVALMANFMPVYTITAATNPSNGGTITGLGNGLFISGTTVSLTANPATGYSFSNWTESGSVVANTPTYSFTATANRSLLANFRSATSATPGSTLWAKAFGAGGGNSVARDSSNNVFIAGSFTGTVDFGGGPLTSAGGTDIYVAKRDVNGSYQWAQRFGGTGDDAAYSIAVDRNGDVFVTGYFSGTTVFGTTTLTSYGGKDIFLVKLSGASGAPLWAKQIANTHSVYDDIGYGVATDPSNGDVALTGVFRQAIDFGGGQVISPNGSTGPTCFVARYTNAGAYLWAHIFSSSGGLVRAEAIAVDGTGSVVAMGDTSTPIDLGGGFLAATSGNSVYVGEYSSTGAYLWGDVFQSSTVGGTMHSGGVAVDASNNVMLTGYYAGTVGFGSGITVSFTVLGSPNTATFLAKLSKANGAPLWATSVGLPRDGGSGSEGFGIAVDSSGNLDLAGTYFGSVSVVGTTLTAPLYGPNEVLAAKLTSTGTLLWAKSFGGTTSSFALGVAADAGGNILVVGETNGGDFGGVTLTGPGGNYAPFLMKLAQ